MKITIFESLMKKEAHRVIDAAEWIRDIRDGKFKLIVGNVRTMIKLGDKDKARDWKMKLPSSRRRYGQANAARDATSSTPPTAPAMPSSTSTTRMPSITPTLQSFPTPRSATL